MKVVDLKYNLYLVDFTQVELEILQSLKKELDKYGLLTKEDLPRADYIKLVNYFTLHGICKTYSELQNKKNTIFYLNSSKVDADILIFIKEIKKYFPIPVYIGTSPWQTADPAVKTEITIKLKEYRYSIDYSKYSFNKIKKFCNKFGLDSLVAAFKP